MEHVFYYSRQGSHPYAYIPRPRTRRGTEPRPATFRRGVAVVPQVRGKLRSRSAHDGRAHTPCSETIGREEHRLRAQNFISGGTL